MPIKHAFTSSNPDGTDPAQVQASHWNADHTGNLTEAEITGLVTDLAAKEATANKNVASGYAPLDASAKLPAAKLPTYTHPASFAFTDFVFSDGAAFAGIGSPSGNIGYVGSGAMDANHPGNLHIESGTVAGAGESGYIGANFSVIALASGPLWRWESAIKLSTVTSAKLRAGIFASHVGNPPTEGYFFQYDSAASPNWRAITTHGGTNDIDTLVPASAGAWIVLRMEGDATSTRFYIDDSLVATSTLNRGDIILRIVWQAIANSTSNVMLDADYLIWFRNVTR